jgi:hypothetical protein
MGIGLKGTIPSTISLLPALTQLDLRNNKIFGTVPSELSELSNLNNLALGGNKLTGVVPSLPFQQYSQFCDFGFWSEGINDFTCPLPPNADKCQPGKPVCTSRA